VSRPSPAEPGQPHASAEPVRRAVVVHSRVHVEAALAVAADLGVPVLLLTAPGAADYAGPGMLLAMLARPAVRQPGADAVAAIDCADAPGRVLAALEAGWKHLLFTGDPAMAARLADACRQGGATLAASRPEALDLALHPDPIAACRAWLRPGAIQGVLKISKQQDRAQHSTSRRPQGKAGCGRQA